MLVNRVGIFLEFFICRVNFLEFGAALAGIVMGLVDNPQVLGNWGLVVFDTDDVESTRNEAVHAEDVQDEPQPTVFVTSPNILDLLLDVVRWREYSSHMELGRHVTACAGGFRDVKVFDLEHFVDVCLQHT